MIWLTTRRTVSTGMANPMPTLPALPRAPPGAMIAVSLLELVPAAWRAAPRPAIIGGLGGWWVLRIGLDFVAAARA